VPVLLSQPTTDANNPHDQAVDNSDAFLALHAEAIRALLIRTKDQIIDVGGRLAECQKHIGHGNWYAWLDREFGWSVDTAENFIHVYEMSKSRNFRDLNLPLSALYLLARPSTPEAARDEVFESAKTDKVAVVDVKQAIAAHKPAKPRQLTEPAAVTDSEASPRKLKQRRTAAEIKSDKFDHAISTFRGWTIVIEDFGNIEDSGATTIPKHLTPKQVQAAIAQLEALQEASAGLIERIRAIASDDGPVVTATVDPIASTPEPVTRTRSSPKPRRDPLEVNWRPLDADALDDVIRETQRFGVDHDDEAHEHKQRRLRRLDRMKKRLVELRAASATRH
jgi:hypothetical protein